MDLVLHAVWLPEEELFVWGEDLREGAPRRRGRGAVALHPFATTKQLLSTRFWNQRGGCSLHPRPGETLLFLPMEGERPRPSSVWRAARGDRGPSLLASSSSRLGGFQVEGYHLVSPGGWMDLSVALRIGGNEVGYAPTMVLLDALRSLAGALLDRGLVLPTIDRGASFLARWVLAREPGWLTEAVDELTRATPASLLAGGQRLEDPRRSGRMSDVIRAILAHLVDAAARLRLRGAPGRSLVRRASSCSEDLGHVLCALSTNQDRVVLQGSTRQLSTSISDWLAPVVDPVRARYRVVLRLVEPESDEGSFRLEIHLRDSEVPGRERRPSELRRDEELEDGGGGPPASLASVREVLQLLPYLCPSTRPLQEEPERDGVELSDEELLRLLMLHHDWHTGDYEFEVPSWWRTRSSRQPGWRIQVSSVQQDATGIEVQCQVDWSLHLGERPLGVEEARRLVEGARPLMRLDDGWVVLDAAGMRDLGRALELVGGAGVLRRRSTLQDLLRHCGAGRGEDEDEDEVGGLPVQVARGLDPLELLRARDGEDPPRSLPAPRGLEATLRPYQEVGLAWLRCLARLGLGACLADDMGLGKTIQLLALEQAERSEAARPPSLLVVPTSLIGNWERETARFAPDLRLHVHHGPAAARKAAFPEARAGSDLILTSYALVRRDRELLTSERWHRVILDEAHHVKNPGSQQARAARALPAAHRVALTGTPVENRTGELWSLMEFLSPGLLGSQRSFRARFANPIERDGDAVAAARLRRVCAPFLLRRTKRDPEIAADLPEKVEMNLWCRLSREQVALYQRILVEMLRLLSEKDGMERRGLVLATLTRLAQVCDHPALLKDGEAEVEARRGESRAGKLGVLDEVVEEVLAAGEKLLVFSRFAKMTTRLRDHLAERHGVAVGRFAGETPREERDELVRRFQEEADLPILVLSLKAGGVGLNLTAANHVVHYDRWWNPAVEDQASDRVWRIGQTRDVQVRRLVTMGTLEERMDRRLEEKRALADAVVGSGESWITELDDEQLRELFAFDEGSGGERA